MNFISRISYYSVFPHLIILWYDYKKSKLFVYNSVLILTLRFYPLKRMTKISICFLVLLTSILFFVHFTLASDVKENEIQKEKRYDLYLYITDINKVKNN